MKIIIKDTEFESIFGDFSIEGYYKEGTLVTIGKEYSESTKCDIVTLHIPIEYGKYGNFRVKYFTKEEFRSYLRKGIFVIVSE
ncbi:MAG TPA: hypothetical protein PKL44_00320 [Candidatus Dojkabacteria bacterium]|nr:hypothetical protein [Candidatus Dojkabacteria bacterium]